MMATTTITLKVSEEDKKRFQNAAERLGVSLSKLLKEGAELRSDFSPYFQDRLRAFSANMGVSESTVIQNLVTSWMARKNAEKELFGNERSWLMEFMFTEDGPIMGEYLYNQLYKNFLAEFRKNVRAAAACQEPEQDHRILDALSIAGIDPEHEGFLHNKTKILPELQKLLSHMEKIGVTDEEKELGLKVFGIDMKRQFLNQPTRA